MNKSDRAIDTLERAVNKAPNVSQGHYHLAMAYLAKNRNAEAKEELKLALASEKTSFLGAEA
jgi:Tfp pilus assembly protein PilF